MQREGPEKVKNQQISTNLRRPDLRRLGDAFAENAPFQKRLELKLSEGDREKIQ